MKMEEIVLENVEKTYERTNNLKLRWQIAKSKKEKHVKSKK